MVTSRPGVLVHQDVVYPAGEIPPSAITETMELGPHSELLQERVSRADEVGTRVPAWKSVTLNHSDLFDCFAAERPAIRAVEATADRQKRLQEWIEGLMRASPDTRTHTSKELERLADKHFGDTSAASIKRAKRAAAEKTGAHAWIAPGRPKKSQRRKSPS